MSKELFSIVEPMHIRYLTNSKVSKTYCEEKLETIIESTEIMQKSMNKRSRWNLVKPYGIFLANTAKVGGA